MKNYFKFQPHVPIRLPCYDFIKIINHNLILKILNIIKKKNFKIYLKLIIF